MKRAVVICPGRGTYNAPELGWLARHFPDDDVRLTFDLLRTEAGQETLTDLDSAARFEPRRHTRGDNASALIYAGGYGDFRCIDRSAIEIVAVTGNSMGWYTALACAGAVRPDAGFTIANTMGTLMQASLIGGQLIYPHMGEDWVPDASEKARLLQLVTEIDNRPQHRLALSIDLGGMLVLAGDEAGLTAFEKAVPRRDHFPLRLENHAAFHTDLVAPVSKMGLERLGPHLFGQPEIPLVDGRGAIWWPHATDIAALRDYTLRTQVTESYNFTHAISIAAREFAPDVFILTGPGSTLGGAIAQSLILANWRGLNDRSAFKSRQNAEPVLIAMGRAEQRQQAG